MRELIVGTKLGEIALAESDLQASHSALTNRCYRANVNVLISLFPES